ncbi:uncharacterized protein BO80DRAFT_441887 [Aspergillus ibericus CBS 121593]|uniref:Uncharacterized protein n=1 Tax=Aspergillus ibericus CBS 121593 TaxID=1448316 RepID=A0A395HAA8_9EURO|nr:hypothetical protein BO80DRAFT_441887 [Aspergillus ibericus CBS 121593]RAL04423.1 hypothetical protein BO80DRAFT_441887 [Aspergillus ibericus CBS 121593]
MPIASSTGRRIEQFLAEERMSYTQKEKEFEKLIHKQRHKMLRNCVAQVDLDRLLVAEEEMDTFMPFEEFIRFRECSSGRLQHSALNGSLSHEQVNALDEEEWWNLQLYAGEVMDSPGFLKYPNLSCS